MWVPSLVISTFAYQTIVRRRPVDAHGCMIGITMLFALPALRSAQPGAPVIGCTSDLVSFYWNMTIIATDGIAIILCWVLRWSEGRTLRTPDPKSNTEQHSSTRCENGELLFKFIFEAENSRKCRAMSSQE